MSNSPHTRLSAAVRVLLDEMEPVANLTAATAMQLEETCTKLHSDTEVLAATIAKSTKAAAASALGESQITFEAMIGKQERRLLNAGHAAAAQIGNQLVGNSRDLITAAADFRDHARTYAAVFMGIAVCAGIVGGLIGSAIGTWLVLR